MFRNRLFRRSFFHGSAEKGSLRPTMMIALLPILIFTTLFLAPKIITNTYFGSRIIRRSELGPLTGSEVSSGKIYGPGHDFGAISSESSFDIRPPAIKPFSYLFDGRMVVRRSELGPLTGETFSLSQVRGPGHDFGAIDGESQPGS